MPAELKTVGKAELRKDAWDKVTGAAAYVDDLPCEGLLYGAVVRSPHHHARIIAIETAAARDLPGVVAVLTADDVPGSKTFGPLVQDQPALACDVVRHMGEPVALVIAQSKDAARRAVAAVQVTYEPLPAVHDPVAALEPDAPPVHESGNLLTRYEVSEGDVAAGLAAADVVIEATFQVPRISPAYMEPEGSMARWNDDGTLTVWVSSQKPFEDRHAIASVLGLPDEAVRVCSAVIGGAFGGKEDSGLPVLAALGAWATRGAVRLVNNRHESFLAHPKRHPARLHYTLGATREGELVALKAVVHMDTGAYASYGPAVGGLLTEMLAGAYRIPNVHVETNVVYTHSPFSGAMRGFGSPQAHFAIESLMDMLAHELSLDPLELRRRNALRPGDRLFTRVTLDRTAESLPLILDHLAAARERLAQKPPAPGRVAGVGIALGMQSMGLGYRVPDDSTNRLALAPDGTVLLYIGSPDLGQGLATVAEQIAAEALGLPYQAVRTVDVDTGVSPNGGVTCASRMTYLIGNSVVLAAQQLIAALLDYAARSLGVPRDTLRYEDGLVITAAGERLPLAEFASRAADEDVPLVAEATFSFPYPEESTPKHLPVGMPHVMLVFGGQAVRVEVDPELGTVTVTDVVAVHDVGQVVNRAGVEGQIEGAVAMGIGYALYESMRLKANGQWVDSFTEYLLPTAEDMPSIESVILEIPEASGPYGVKGVGEMGLVPVAPAIANAVFQATGVRAQSIPITPEVIARPLGD
ncbi:MAG: xanthine dehydrogenase family protein molybdopterin-binding subunit [Aggregatilineaceae bacterium]